MKPMLKLKIDQLKQQLEQNIADIERNSAFKEANLKAKRQQATGTRGIKVPTERSPSELRLF